MSRSNRSRLVASTAVAGAWLIALAMLAAPVLAAGHAVAIRDTSFSPKTITIRAGDTITWTNRSSYIPHNVIFASFGSTTSVIRSWINACKARR